MDRQNLYIITGLITGFDFRPIVYNYQIDHETDHYFHLIDHGVIVKKRKDAKDLHYARDIEGLKTKLKLLKTKVIERLESRLNEYKNQSHISILDINPDPYDADVSKIEL